MRNKLTLPSGVVLVLMLQLAGCSSTVTAPAECPQFVPSPEALRPIEGTGWRPLAKRVLETYSRPPSTP